MMKKSYVYILVAILIVAGFFVFKSQKKVPILDTIKKDNISAYVLATGNVESAGEVKLYSPTNGVITELYINNGDSVIAGQKLFKVKSTASDQDKAVAYAAYATANTNLASIQSSQNTLKSTLEDAKSKLYSAENKYNIMKKNVAEDRNNPDSSESYTDDEIKSIKSAQTSAQAAYDAALQKFNDFPTSLDTAKANLSAAWWTYQATQTGIVNAPADGIVSNFSSVVGSKVEAKITNPGSSAQSEPVLVVSNLSKKNIKMNVTELNVSKIALGQTTDIKIESIPGKTFKGTVSFVDNIGNVVQGVVSYKVLVDFDPSTDFSSENIKSGMTANLTIQTDSRSNVLSVSNGAIKYVNGNPSVDVYTNGTTTTKQLKLGLRGSPRTEVLEGLNENDTVVVGTN